MKDITSSIYDFETLIKGGYLYIDKTEYLWNLIRRTGESYFLARPRRFGKSLTISTLKAVFEGKKELFEGLAISRKNYDWKTYPVIHLSFADISAGTNTPEGIKKYLLEKVDAIAAKFSIVVTSDEPGMRLGQMIDELKKTSKVVILVDEYDKPLIDNIQNLQADLIRNELSCFYSVLKDRNDALRMLFVTGVTKFSHVSMFSGFNNPDDISMRREYATMMGYTQEELEKYFADNIELACKQTGKSREELLPEIKAWYDGYRFEEKSESVYNPVSVARFFENNFKFNNYWFSTGTPTFLMKLAQEKNFDIEKTIENPSIGLAFSAFDVDNIDPKNLLLQTGYLTIKDSEVDLGETLYYLDFPNREVKSSFETYLLNAYTGISEEEIGSTVFNLHRAIRTGDVEHFMDLLKTFFANIRYDVGSKVEGRYQLLFYAIFTLLGVRIDAETVTNDGRIDAVIFTAKSIYLFEFKIDGSAKTAMEQIIKKEYYQKYKHSGKDIILIGANFSTKTRQLTDWKIGKA